MYSLLWFWLLLFLIVTFLTLLMPALWGKQIYNHFRGTRAVSCPETHRPVAVSFDALHAAVTGFFRKPDLRLAKCTLWPMDVHCAQACIPEAARTEPYTRGEIERPKTKKIYHIPVFIAAFVSWLLGAVWHSQYLFRPRWMQALGVSRTDLHQIVWWWTPHLVSVAACLLFAYGVAWLLVWVKPKSMFRGIVAALVLWCAVTLATVFATDIRSAELLRIEFGYTLLASVVVGTIIGGLDGKLIVER